MSTTTATDLKTSSDSLKAAESELSAALADLTKAGFGVVDAAAEIQRVQSAVEAGDNSISLNDLTTANAALSFHQMKQQAKARAVQTAQETARQAKIAHLLARVASGDYGISGDALRAEGTALANQIATMLSEHRAKCDAHEAARAQLLADVKEITKDGEVDALAWGREYLMPDWVSVNGERIPFVTPARTENISQRAAKIVTNGTDWADQHYTV